MFPSSYTFQLCKVSLLRDIVSSFKLADSRFPIWAREIGWFFLFLLLAFIAWIPALLNGSILSLTYVWDPWGIVYSVPFAQLSGSLLLEGYFPLWNPHVGAGVPFMANIQTAAIFPFHLLQSLLPIWPPDLAILIKFASAGYFAGLFARRGLNAGAFAGLFSGVIYMLSGRHAEYINTHIINAELMLPLVFLVMKNSAVKRGFKALLPLVGIFCMLALAGQPESALYYSVTGFMFYAMHTLVANRGSAGSFSKLAGRLALPIICGLIGVLMASAVIVPFAEYFALGWNHHFELIGKAHYEARHLSSLVFPGLNFLYAREFFTRLPIMFPAPAEEGMKALLGLPAYIRYSVPMPFNYAGITACLLTIMAIFNLKRLNPDTAFFVGMLVLVLGIVFGLPSFNNLLELPIINQMSNFRFLQPVIHFSISALCALVLSSSVLRRGFKGKTWKVIIAAGLISSVVLLGYLTHQNIQLPPKFMRYVFPIFMICLAWLALMTLLILRLEFVSIRSKAAILVLAFVELIAWQRVSLVSVFRHPLTTAPAQLIETIKNQTSNVTLGQGAPMRFHATSGVVMPNLATKFGLYDVRNTDSMLPKRYTNLMARALGMSDMDAKAMFYFSPAFYLNNKSTGRQNTSPWDMLGVKLLVSRIGKLGYRETEANEILRIGDEYEIVENSEALPFAWLAPKAVPARSAEEALDMVFSEDFNPSEEVIIEGVDEGSLSKPAPECSQMPKTISFSSQKIEIETGLESGCFLVISQEYYPGWRAFSQGRELKILHADYMLKGIKLGPLDTKISLRYEPVSFKLGLWVTLSSLGLLIALWASLKLDTLFNGTVFTK